MKIFTKIAAALIILSLFVASTVSAQGLIITGTTEPDSYGVAILVTQKGKDVNALTSKDIVWISQHDVDQNGKFNIMLPLFSESDYDFYTSASEFKKGDGTGKMYVASTAAGDCSGTDNNNPATFDVALENIHLIDEIVIVDNVTYSNIPSTYYGNLKITGLTGNEVLTLPGNVHLKGNLTFDNLALKTACTMYANGYSLVIGENTTSDRMTVYGGSNGSACESTDVKLYGGQYAVIYGGGNNGGIVNGNTNVVLGGNANPGYGITSETAAELKCTVYGGGRVSKVNGATNVTLEGNAITNYIIGSGSGEGAVVSETYININGGKVMNVYGGSKQDITLTGCDTHITMTGGVAEALFGGSELASMSGNTYITVKGGEVLRRIYGGSYNSTSGLLSLSWNTNHYVDGTTNVILYPNNNLITGKGLTWDNTVNSGIFATSRRGSASDKETGSIFFMDGSYTSLKSKIGEVGSSYKSYFNSFHIYTIDSASGGSITPNGAGNVTVLTTNGKTALSGGKRYMNGQQISLAKNAVTSIVYDGIDSADITDAQANVGVTSSVAGELYASIYNESGQLVFAGLTKVSPGTDNYHIDIDYQFEANKKYEVKLFLWEEKATLVPIAGSYIFEVKK